MSNIDNEELTGERIRRMLGSRDRQQKAIAHFIVSTFQSARDLQTLIAAKNAFGEPSPETDEAIDHLTRCIENHFFECFGHKMIADSRPAICVSFQPPDSTR